MWMLSLPGGLPAFFKFQCSINLIQGEGFRHGGCLWSGLEEVLYIRVYGASGSGFWTSVVSSFHFPLLTRTEAMKFAVTGYCFGALFRQVSLLMVIQALLLEWVKFILEIFFFPSYLPFFS